ncbi:MAG TPA: MarR family transcriptional regulator [Candidatus Eisenbergiella merdipullorum]|uniref:MarR family transcriptional regulator n=1 Tax=Candidatus Eisenbergiella merdipullorum TaxID=2838553 RepID=A0A9D2KY15_9FIRM|nr:MarR family transcriptional regulator [Candidatus Eisenbergiella merdipullorum]
MESLHYLLMKAHTRMNRSIMGGAAGLGLSSGQPKVLEYLLQYGESDQKTIASYCEIEPATVGSILTRMEAAGLIQRERHEGNRRSLYVTLTREGRKMAERMELIFTESEKRACTGMTAEEEELLKELLAKVSAVLSDEA